MKPHISCDENNNTTLEWWVGERKITMYPREGILLKVWETDIEELSIEDTTAVRAAFNWLYEKAEPKEMKV